MKGHYKPHTIETKEMIRLKKLGQKHSTESKNKMSKSRKNVKHSEEWKEKISKSIKAWWDTGKEGKGATGRHFKMSNEQRKKLSEIHKGKKKSEQFKINLREYQKKFNSRRGKKLIEIYGSEKAKILLDILKNNRINQVRPIKDTSIEVKIQNFLEQLKIEYFKHKYMNIEHGYQCDLFIPSLNLVIECDGNYWHKYPTGNEIDHIRTKELLDKGFKVLRLWESEIKSMNVIQFNNKIMEVKP